tara:strand:+ start:434 stop:2653 length:2220 start_codon:yes stop_codon:yes gene_type:complete
MELLKQDLQKFDNIHTNAVFKQLEIEAPKYIKDQDLYNLAIEISAGWINKDQIYNKIASTLLLKDLHRKTTDSFSSKTVIFDPMLNREYAAFCAEHKERIDAEINYENDNLIDYFGLTTLKKGYLVMLDGDINTQERPQDMWMRVSLYLNIGDIESAMKSYHMMSNKRFTHATPTLFYAGLIRSQMLSCFLIGMDDSIEGIFDTIKDCALISKYAGGIGLHLSNIRGSGAWVKGTQMESPGIVAMLQVVNETVKYLNRNNKRHSSIAAYLEPWHTDVESFLEIRSNTGNQEEKCRDIFTALWVPDIFMEHVENDLDWYLFSPDVSPRLYDTWGDEFRTVYFEEIVAGNYTQRIKARDLWAKIVTSQIETGTPYLVYKDSCNSKSNQQNLGTIRSSNLCAEIVQYSDSKEFSCCTLASIGLPAFVDAETKTYDYEKLRETVEQVVSNLDSVIDRNFYPVERSSASNYNHRPLGIGVQGLMDVFQILDLPIESDEAAELNRRIFENIYYAAATRSCQLAEKLGTYKSYEGSPASKGQLSYDLWGEIPRDNTINWKLLKENIKKHGLRHSLLVACMPTASTSQILGNTECFEPLSSNVFSRRTLMGEFIVSNKILVSKMQKLGLWTEEVQQQLMADRGSIQKIKCIPDNIKKVFKTVWEISQKVLIDMAADRGPFVDQSQSLNLFLKSPEFNQVSSMHFYAWKKGLKTGIYYLRSQGAAHAEMFSVGSQFATQEQECEMCSA